MEIAETKFVREALALAALLKETPGASVGEIIARPHRKDGGGSRDHDQPRRDEGLRLRGNEPLCPSRRGDCRRRNRRAVHQMDADAFRVGPSQSERPILILDEANKLRWQALEALRYLADECGFAVLLVGTEIYERQFVSAKTRPLLLQLGRRIGAKRARMGHLDRAETFTHVLNARFGDVDRETATKFWQGCRKGNWGEAVELAEECLRICRANNVSALTMPVLEAALTWTANRREVGAA